MSSEHDHGSGCCLCSCLTYLALFAILIAVLLQTRFRYTIKMVYYLFTFIIGGTVGALWSLPNGKTPANHFRIFKVFHLMNSVFGLKYTLRNKQYIESEEAFILIANHQSCLDVIGMGYCWPENCVVMLKSSLKFLPGFNLCAYICNSIYINRFSKEKAHKTVDSTLSTILENKRKVWIYPEGTRNPEKTLLPFKKGAFIIAKQANIPIVICVFSSQKFFYEYATGRFDSGESLVEFLPPVDSTKFETVDVLTEHCRNLMQETQDRLNAEMEQKLDKKIN